MGDFEVIYRYYDYVRGQTLRLLRQCSQDTLDRLVPKTRLTCGKLFATIAANEEAEINGRFTRNWSLPGEFKETYRTEKALRKPRVPSPAKEELDTALMSLKKQTDRFLKALEEHGAEGRFFIDRYGEKKIKDTMRKLLILELTSTGKIQLILEMIAPSGAGNV